MNFKGHVEYSIMLLNEIGVGQGTDLFYPKGCGVEIPRQLEEEAQRMVDLGAGKGFEGSTSLSFVVSHLQWARLGLNTFDPTVSLTAALMITTPTREPGFPRMPYPAFFVRVPPGFVPFWPTDEARPEWIEGILVSRQRVAGKASEEVLNLELFGSGGTTRDDRGKALSVSIADWTVRSPAEYVKIDDNLWDWQRRMGEHPEDPSARVDPGELSLERQAGDDITYRQAFRLVVNLCSWLESVGGLLGRRPSNALRESRKHDNRGWDEIAGKTRITQWVLGQEVKLSPELIASAREHVLGLGHGKRAGGWQLRSLHTVRGHIRHQACGPRHTERKIIWVEPFTRGPAGGDVVAHVYRAQQRERKS